MSHFFGLTDEQIKRSRCSGKQTGLLFAKAKTAQKREYEATSRDVNRLMRLFGSTIGALGLAREEGLDVWDALDADIGWSKLLGPEDEATAIADMACDEPLIRAADRYMTLRRYAPALLDAFRFKAAGSRDGVLGASKVVRALNASGHRDVPVDALMPFSKRWKAAITEGQCYRPSLLRDRDRCHGARVVQSGDLWLEGTRDHQRFDSYPAASFACGRGRGRAAVRISRSASMWRQSPGS